MEPFAPEVLERRTEFARRAALAAGLDGLLLTPGPDLTHFAGELPVAASERLIVLLLPAVGEPVLVVPKLESGAVREHVADGIRVVSWSDADDPYRASGAAMVTDGRYAISDAAWALQLVGLQRALPGARFTSMTDAVPLLRAVKGSEEVERLAEAGAAADETFEQIVGARFRGVSEREIAGQLADLLTKFGHEQVDFTIVGSGANGANPHHMAGERVIEQGDMVVLDFGGLKNGYGSDTTRTVHVGEPDEEERRVYEVVREAQQAAFEAVAPGVTCQEIDRVARAHITDAGYGEYFVHRVGHGIGLTTHEPPYMVEGEEHAIVPGMCFSIEPGIYLPSRFGVRIEDIVVATDDGARRLNTTTRELQLVE